MLPKKERLKRVDFSRFFSVGKRIHSASFVLIYSQHPTLHASVVVSKKVHKSAVVRNKLRRRIYDMVRRYRDEGTRSGVYIFVTKNGADKKTFQELHQEVTQALAKIKV